MAKKLDLGPTGKRVAERVHHYRERNNLTFAELARRLGDAGHPIPPLGLRRIESEERKVTVDDLTALAVVLEVSVVDLLVLPPLADDGPESTENYDQATGVQSLPAYFIREWIQSGARRYLHPGWDWESEELHRITRNIVERSEGKSPRPLTSDVLRSLRDELLYPADRGENHGDD